MTTAVVIIKRSGHTQCTELYDQKFLQIRERDENLELINNYNIIIYYVYCIIYIKIC